MYLFFKIVAGKPGVFCNAENVARFSCSYDVFTNLGGGKIDRLASRGQ